MKPDAVGEKKECGFPSDLYTVLAFEHRCIKEAWMFTYTTIEVINHMKCDIFHDDREPASKIETYLSRDVLN